MSDLVERLRKDPIGTRMEAAEELERLRAALRALLADIADYERVNNLAPNPGKQDCWQSVTQAREALGQKEAGDD